MRVASRAIPVILLLLVNCLITTGQAQQTTPFLRMYVTTNRYTYSLVDTVVLSYRITNIQINNLTNVVINSSVYDSNDLLALSIPKLENISIPGLTTIVSNVSASFSLRDANYLVVTTAFLGRTEIGSANIPLVVLDTAGRQPLTLAFVFHMHQPIYLNLEGQFEQPWVQLHSGSDFEDNGTWYGAYLWHVEMLERHPQIKVTFNLQPSLLYQWNVTMHGFEYNGSYPGGEQELARDLRAVNEAVAGYRELATEGRVEILTSPFYHPLSALLVQLGLSGDFLQQLLLGENYTRDFMGVNARGMWTPEMGFTMGMVPLIQQAGIQYTVLDGMNHFVGSEGPSANASMYQPFELYGANGSHIFVFFRDSQISTDFSNNWNRIPDPEVAASEFIASVADVYRRAPGGVLTVASDGENPIAQGEGLISALDYDSIYGAIGSQGWLHTSTLGSILANRTVTAKLSHIPDGSWSGGFGLWIGNPSKTAIWDAIIHSRKVLVNLTSEYGANNPEIKKLWNYLYVAEGSDWEWQTPTGPAWFAMQGYRYAHASANYVPPPLTQATQTSPFFLEAAAVCGAIVIVAVALIFRRRKRS